LIADLCTLVGFRDDVKFTSAARTNTFGAAVTAATEAKIVSEAADELSRAGSFDRIYPASGTSRYDMFFDQPRPLNHLLYSDLGRTSTLPPAVIVAAPATSSVKEYAPARQPSPKKRSVSAPRARTAPKTNVRSKRSTEITRPSEYATELYSPTNPYVSPPSIPSSTNVPVSAKPSNAPKPSLILTPLMAREAFAVYLQRMRERLHTKDDDVEVLGIKFIHFTFAVTIGFYRKVPTARTYTTNWIHATRTCTINVSYS